MTGEQLESFLNGKGVKKIDVAEKLGMSLQNFCAIFRTKDIKTGMLERISAATNISIPEFYGSTAGVAISTGEGNTQVAGNNIKVNSEGVVDLLAKKDEQIDRLLTIIESMTKQKNN